MASRYILSEKTKVKRVDRGDGSVSFVSVEEAVRAAVRNGIADWEARNLLRTGRSIQTAGFACWVERPH